MYAYFSISTSLRSDTFVVLWYVYICSIFLPRLPGLVCGDFQILYSSSIIIMHGM